MLEVIGAVSTPPPPLSLKYFFNCAFINCVKKCESPYPPGPSWVTSFMNDYLESEGLLFGVFTQTHLELKQFRASEIKISSRDTKLDHFM